MKKDVFLSEYAEPIHGMVRLSSRSGMRSDYIQGGGGNTSVKLDSRLMAVKASGFRLGQVSTTDAYSVVDYSEIRRYFTHPVIEESSADRDKNGTMAVRHAMVEIDGMPSIRPSVEAGFHALLDTCVLHTHSVYANLVCCGPDAHATAASIMDGMDLPWGFVPYVDPGTALTFVIEKEIRRVARTDGKPPAVLFLQNHGLVVSTSDADSCISLHDRVNQAVADHFMLPPDAWPNPGIQGTDTGWVSATPWMRTRLAGWNGSADGFWNESLYPDQLVYLTGKIGFKDEPGCAENVVCWIDRETGRITYSCDVNEARTIEETLCAVLFILEVLAQAGRSAVTMDHSAKAFIAGWESEAYRKAVNEGKKS